MIRCRIFSEMIRVSAPKSELQAKSRSYCNSNVSETPVRNSIQRYRLEYMFPYIQETNLKFSSFEVSPAPNLTHCLPIRVIERPPRRALCYHTVFRMIDCVLGVCEALCGHSIDQSYGTWKNAFFLQEKTHAHKIPRFGGGGVFWVLGGGKCRFYFMGARIFLSIWWLEFAESQTPLHCKCNKCCFLCCFESVGHKNQFSWKVSSWCSQKRHCLMNLCHSGAKVAAWVQGRPHTCMAYVTEKYSKYKTLVHFSCTITST